MKISLLKEKIENGALSQYSNIYSDVNTQKSRFVKALEKYAQIYGEDGEVMILSVPGRSEISGNHTDHNLGKVLAGAIDRDIICVAARSSGDTVRLYSEGYGELAVPLSKTNTPSSFGKYTSEALIAGVINAFRERGYAAGGFTAYLTSDVLKGSGISSSAAYEVMLGNVLNHLYNGGSVDNKTLAKIAKYAENVYFGKPSGLMDQMACAVGGFVYMDFENHEEPLVEPIDFSLEKCGFALAIINTGGNHADLNEDYSSVPREMHGIASLLGHESLRSASETELLDNICFLRKAAGDRAVLRALHFFRENERVSAIKDALKVQDVRAFLDGINESGSSSFKYLQNVYTNKNVREQGISLALALAEGILGKDGACRVHGGGFAGTVQVFIKREKINALKALMDSVFGENSTLVLNVRPIGAARLF